MHTNPADSRPQSQESQEPQPKGVIVAAGYGTRFLPATNTVPKEMLPLLNKPSIAFIVEEMAAAGIREIIVISSRRKKSLEDYFDRELELEGIFRKEKAQTKLDAVTPDPRIHVSFVRQQEMRGTGHALLQVKPLLGGAPALVAYPDDLHLGTPPLAQQLLDRYRETGCSVMASIHNPPNLERYGVLDLAPDGLHVQGMAEKPAPGNAPSREVSIGRYLFTSDFFTALEEGWNRHLQTGSPGEYYHLYALEKLMKENRVVYKDTEGERLDTGEPAGFLRAQIRYAARFPEYKAVLQEEFGRLNLAKE